MQKVEGKMDNLFEIMQQGMIQIPKEVMIRTDVGDDTKMMFSIIFTEAIGKINGTHEITKQVYQTMEKRINEITTDEIKNECICSDKKSKTIKNEMKKLISDIDLDKCFIKEVE